MNRISIVAVVLASLFALHGARAATSIPLPEAGFALASNDAITSSMPGDLGGGSSHPKHATEVVADAPDSDVARGGGGSSTNRDDHAQKPTPNDGNTANNSSTTTRKSRGNAHWQALLPGLMR
jgi:hypothetical protein